MKSGKIHKTRSLFPALAVFVGALLCAEHSRSENRGPVLAAPMNDVEMIDEDDYVPQTIVHREASPTTARRLPTTAARDHGQPVVYEMPQPPSRGSVIPQRFLDEDETVPKPVTQPQKKTPKPLAETDDEIYFMDDEVLYEDDLVLPRFRRRAIVAQSTESIHYDESDFYAQNFDGIYAEHSPVLNGYTTHPIIKPFGTGMTDNLTFFSGATAFRNELDPPEKGNFGLSMGTNWAGPATPQGTVSAQAGFRSVLTNLYGNASSDEQRYRKPIRDQYFVTAGLFKRDLGTTFQGGAVYDWCFDKFYGKITLQQVRVEASLRTFSNLEYGFQGAYGTTREKSDWISRLAGTPEAHYRAQNCYLLFGRKHLHGGGLAEFRIGATDYGDIIIGGLGEFPLNDRLALNGAFSLLCPKEGNSRQGLRRETWEVSIGMVFYFRGGACSKPINPCRPMFDVAGNGSFFGRLFR